LSTFRTTNFCIGMLFGITLVIYIKNPFVMFQIAGAVGFVITIAGCYLSDEMETNKYALQAIALEDSIYAEKQSKKNTLLSKSMVEKKKGFCETF